jgi:hypothetical protein
VVGKKKKKEAEGRTTVELVFPSHNKLSLSRNLIVWFSEKKEETTGKLAVINRNLSGVSAMLSL